VRTLGAGGVSSLYFAYFAFIGIYSPYLSLWFDARGLGIPEIALLMSMPQLLRIVAPPFWGWLADRSGRRVELLRGSAWAAFGLLLLLPWAGGLGGLMALMLAVFFLTAAQMPIAEAVALQIAGGDSGRYGRMRLWGSVGFVLTVVAGGPLLAAFGLHALPWLMAAAMAGLAFVTTVLPRTAPVRAERPAVDIAARLREPAVIAFMASAFLMVFAHAALYAFFSLFLERHGWGTSAIGAIWGLGVLAEIVLFTVQRHVFALASPMALLGFSFAVCALRFGMVAASDGALAVLLPAQLMHAVTFGLHHSASMAVLHRWFEPVQQARAQAAFIVVAYGLGGSSGGLAMGWLWETVAPEAAFAGAAVAAALGGVAVVLAARLEARRSGGHARG
jgi:PPP family 3-phenylpropionic acid transporter